MTSQRTTEYARRTYLQHQQEREVEQLAQNIAVLRWAEAQVKLPHDQEIQIPPTFDRADALAALEQAVIRKYSTFPIPVVLKPAPIPWSDIALGMSLGLAIIAAVVAIYGAVRGSM